MISAINDFSRYFFFGEKGKMTYCGKINRLTSTSVLVKMKQDNILNCGFQTTPDRPEAPAGSMITVSSHLPNGPEALPKYLKTVHQLPLATYTSTFTPLGKGV